MKNLYIAFVSTPGIFASVIRTVLKQKYVHVAISLDLNLNQCYSIGRRNPAIPLLAGFEKEDKNRILKKYPNAEYMICRIQCTAEQKEQVRTELAAAMERRFSIHYTIWGLPLILRQVPFRQKRSYTCSSYIAELLETCGIWTWDKHTSIVTPKDFFLHGEKEIIYEGKLEEIAAAGHCAGNSSCGGIARDGKEKICGVKLLYER